MFEKEAFSRWFKENTPKEGLSENTTFTRQFLIDAWDNGYINGYNKANEWHFVKDELPPAKKEYNGRSEPVLVVSKNKEIEYAQYIEKARVWARGICAIGFKPYAWKEIVFPKEIE